MQTYFSHAIRDALAEEMERDPRVILIGEDIAEYGGAFKVTAGFAERFGKQRVRNTPISEGGFTGVAVGAALTGLRPVVEMMFADFVTLALDQLVNHAAKFNYMYNGQVTVPLVMRLPSGAGRGYGPTHSGSMERYLYNTPGLRVVAPSDAADAKGMLKAAIRCEEPVCFIESKLLYGKRGEVPEGDYVVPLDQARVVREGDAVTIIAYSRMTGEALRAAGALAERGVECAVVDLRSLAPLDVETLAASVRATQRVVVVEEGSLTGGVGAEVVARVVESCFDYLEAPPLRVAAADTPIPASPALERAGTPDAQRIAEAVLRLVS
ncbi:MAG TPA: alpha-ketoacid dehydrogenase subunit beta [Armatimonadota bacterium]|jgi:pyruvate dehydrogenase E1 component beta subunit